VLLLGSGGILVAREDRRPRGIFQSLAVLIGILRGFLRDTAVDVQMNYKKFNNTMHVIRSIFCVIISEPCNVCFPGVQVSRHNIAIQNLLNMSGLNGSAIAAMAFAVLNVMPAGSSRDGGRSCVVWPWAPDLVVGRFGDKNEGAGGM
jgi:hypothetical protein